MAGKADDIGDGLKWFGKADDIADGAKALKSVDAAADGAKMLGKNCIPTNMDNGADLFRHARFKKNDFKTVDEVANRVGVNRIDFGNYIHETKKHLGMKADQNFTYQELVILAKELADMMK